MFFCRHHLLRAPAQRHFAAFSASWNVSRVSSSPSHRSWRGKSSLPPHSNADYDGPSTPETVGPPRSASNFHESLSQVKVESEQSAGQDAAKPSAADSPYDPSPTHQLGPSGGLYGERNIQEYLACRAQGQDAIACFSSSGFKGAIWAAVHGNRSDVLQDIVEDALFILNARRNKIRGRMVVEELFRTISVKPMLSRMHILELLQCLKKHDQLNYLGTATRTVLAWGIGRLPLDKKLDPKILELLVPLLLEKIKSITSTTIMNEEWAGDVLWSTDDGTAVPRVLWPLYQLCLRLVLLGLRTQATELLAVLVNRECIEAEAINATDLSSSDLLYVVLSVLVLTCLRHGWFTRATTLVMNAIPHQQEISPSLAHLVEQWLSRALDAPRIRDVQSSAAAIIIIFQRATKEYILPTNILTLFYEGAMANDLPEIALTVYSHSREVQHLSYPPPRDMALLRMMEHCDTEAHNFHMARTLASQIIDEDIYLPPHIRSRFIMHIAVLGFSSHARALWERYSTGGDGIHVVGNPKLMLRLTSLFVRNADHIRRILNRRHNSEDQQDDWWSDDQDSVSEPATQCPSDAEGASPATDVQSSHSTPPPHAPPNSGQQPSDASARSEHGAEGHLHGFAMLSDLELVEREKDFRQFADQVFDAFYHTKLPLEEASHYDLTTLARGAAIVGRGTLPMDILLLMKQRNMRMDMRDVNVALSAIARHAPQKAADYLERMIESGLQPDIVSFGTVIHWAARRREGQLAQSLVQKSRSSGFKTLDYKTLASLLHTAVRGGLLEDSSPEAVLEYAEETMERMLDLRVIPTPRVARNAVTAALRAEAPVKAYNFWKRYIKGKVEWEDSANYRVRESVKQQIEAHMKVGWVDATQAHVMLLELNDPEDLYTRPPRPAPISRTQPTHDAKDKKPEDG